MDSINNLKQLFSKFPAVGPKMASRFVFHLIHSPKQDIEQLVQAIQALKTNVALCSYCFQPFEKISDLAICHICSNSGRNPKLLCIVEKEQDITSIENTGRYQGLYFIIGNNDLTLRTINENNLRIEALKKRVEQQAFTEIIIATNPTPEGKTISTLIQRALKELLSASAKGTDKSSGSKGESTSGWKITHLAQGLPVGGELEYADEETLESALEGRK